MLRVRLIAGYEAVQTSIKENLPEGEISSYEKVYGLISCLVVFNLIQST